MSRRHHRPMHYRIAPWAFFIFGMLAAVQQARGETLLMIGFGLASIGFCAVWLFEPNGGAR